MQNYKVIIELTGGPNEKPFPDNINDVIIWQINLLRQSETDLEISSKCEPQPILVYTIIIFCSPKRRRSTKQNKYVVWLNKSCESDVNPTDTLQSYTSLTIPIVNEPFKRSIS